MLLAPKAIVLNQTGNIQVLHHKANNKLPGPIVFTEQSVTEAQVH